MFPKSFGDDLVSAHSSVVWNANLVPYVQSDSDADAAFLLGVTQYFLRAFQFELLRRVAEGRISESIGPLGNDIDHTLRIFDFGKRSNNILQAMDPQAKLWIQNFVRGINFAQKNTAEPFEFSFLKIKSVPWTTADLVSVTRVLSADVNWFTWIKSLSIKQETGPDSNKLSPWQLEQIQILERVFLSLSKSGSNTWVIGPTLSQNGKGYIASDPHVGIIYPNLWLLAGIDSPSIKVVGMMLPAIPFVLLGRNEHMAWGGTNMRGMSTEFFNISQLDPKQFVIREELIKTRFYFDKKVQIRNSSLGPVLSDSPIFKDSQYSFAVKWMGHEVSDELGSFFKMNRAKDAKEFRAAFANYAVSAQNFLYIDSSGNIGHVLATRQPKRNYDRAQFGPLLDPSDDFLWKEFRGPLDLQVLRNPLSGFLASANDKPNFEKTQLGLFFAPSDRSQRIKNLISQKTTQNEKISLQDSILWQTDVFSQNAFDVKNRVVKILKEKFKAGEGFRDTNFKSLDDWDGRFEASSKGALIYSCMEAGLVDHIEARWQKQNFSEGSDQVQSLKLDSSSSLRELLKSSKIFQIFTTDDWTRILKNCFEGDLKVYSNWGEKHPLKFAHPFSNIPLVGKGFQLLERGESGSFDTIMKRAHRVNSGSSSTTYGATARHVSDMANIDENYFVLFGGQDSWVKSDAGSDQIALWDESKYLKIPLSKQLRSEYFPIRIK